MDLHPDRIHADPDPPDPAGGHAIRSSRRAPGRDGRDRVLGPRRPVHLTQVGRDLPVVRPLADNDSTKRDFALMLLLLISYPGPPNGQPARPTLARAKNC